MAATAVAVVKAATAEPEVRVISAVSAETAVSAEKVLTIRILRQNQPTAATAVTVVKAGTVIRRVCTRNRETVGAVVTAETPAA